MSEKYGNHKELQQKQMRNSEITNYEGASPETKVSPDFFEKSVYYNAHARLFVFRNFLV